jgi:peptidyl-prolyl cis-trans isomerase SurA
MRPLGTLSVLLLVGFLTGPAPHLSGQELMGLRPAAEGSQLVDRVAAVVGDSIILASEVTEQLLRMQAAGVPFPTDPAELAELEREVLDDLIQQQLFLQAAAADSTITLSEDRVEDTLRDAWEDQVNRFGTEAAFREALEAQGQSLASYRAGMRDDIRRTLLLQSYMQSRRQEARLIPVEEAEVEAFYARERSRLGRRPATLSFRQIVLLPMPSDSAKAVARAEAERIQELIRQGDDFADLARRFSGDPGSRQAGGDLGWYRRGSGLVQEFEDAAFSMREGEIRGPVETQFGAHILRIERIRGAERKIHHILVAAEVTADDVVRARERVEEIQREISEGAPFSRFLEAHQMPALPDSLEITQDQLGQLPSGYAAALRTARGGELLGPVEFPSQGNSAFALIQVLAVRDEGEFTLDDLRPQIRERIRSEKFEERLVEELKARTFIEIRR